MTQNTKYIIWSLLLVSALVLSFLCGHWLAKTQAKMAMLCGPYSDDYIPALNAISKAKTKIANGDNDITQELDQVQYHIEHADAWARRFIGHDARTIRR